MSIYFVLVSTINFILISRTCSTNHNLKYVWGDAIDDPLALAPDGTAYPWDLAAKIAARQRSPRSYFDSDGDYKKSQQLLSPQETRRMLLNAFQFQDFNPHLSVMSAMTGSDAGGGRDHGQRNVSRARRQGKNFRQGRAEGQNSVKPESEMRPVKPVEQGQGGCVPSRLCASTFNTTAPLYGVSLTSGKSVTIVQKFPDLLQQVVFQVCKTKECEVLQGECVQTYLPYLFLVIPLGPVTLTGQDYVLVESGCVCQPKYAQKYSPPPLPFIQPVPPQ